MYLCYDVLDVGFPECFLEVTTLGYFSFGYVDEDVADLENVVQVGLAVGLECEWSSVSERREKRAYTPVLHSWTLFL